ncbi:thiamine pyrophosphate-binding protein [Jannaschia aquimarina]|uniref:IlvG protein n=1 Tax=Jannaschia aquimarina TaxID=935700 RepID=A0A0D1DDD4_9RHOB|nr:thiamine pyrophosphate-binding protein [Jannaschia aquimarina]KIT18008.1 Acetolactate synthase isozyme 2 large subunit [Jannaschia aquimarina]SNS88433.1 acetolactate synthase-1/2/3 large subunit [Jannaschia aquimarina]
MRHGGQILADELATHGVRRVFSVPGESFLAALDGLFDSGIQNVVCRHEGGAAMMAEATAKLTGRPGVAFVTRGPGATNASSGLHVAMQDSTPLILFVGQIARGHRDREAFQEVDYRALFGSLVKWVAEVDQTERLPEYVARAFSVAQSGRPGPVVLALPEDMLSAHADTVGRPPVESPQPAVPDLDPVVERLRGAERPLVVVGGSGWSADAAADLTRWAERHGLPVAVSFRRQDYIDNRSAAYAGDLNVGPNPKLMARLQGADLIVALGTRLGDIATGGYETLDPATETPALVHVHPSASELNRVWSAEIAVQARAADVVAALAARDDDLPGWHSHQAAARANYEAWIRPRSTPGEVKLEEVIAHLDDVLPDDAILTNGAGNYAAFLHRYYRWRQYGTQLAPTSGSMGYGFPAAIAASIEHPDRDVVCLAGDGCFQMTLNECSTAIQCGARPVVIVCDNGRYGTIRMHQERHYPGRVSGTELVNPDFAVLARSYGGKGWTVTEQASFAPALAEARACGTLAIIHLKLDPRMLSTGTDLETA